MKKYEFKRLGNMGMITFYGDLIVDRIQECKEALLLALHNADRLVVNFKKVTKIDMAILEIICMVHRMSVSLNKNLLVIGTGNHVFKQAMQKSGCSFCFDCLMS
jgi:anti-anti-sigma regulatory factor